MILKKMLWELFWYMHKLILLFILTIIPTGGELFTHQLYLRPLQHLLWDREGEFNVTLCILYAYNHAWFGSN